jgi:hypothetical protein
MVNVWKLKSEIRNSKLETYERQIVESNIPKAMYKLRLSWPVYL